jgi:hypothetical protein
METIRFVGENGKVFFECRPAEARVAIKTIKSSRKEYAKYWEEKDFVFEGVPGTEYEWPKDRVIMFQYQWPKDNVKRIPCVRVPVFNCEKVGGLEKNLSSVVRGCKGEPTYLHVIKVSGHPSCVGIMAFRRKLSPATDFYEKRPDGHFRSQL